MSKESEDRMRRARAIVAGLRPNDTSGAVRHTDPDTSHEAARDTNASVLEELTVLTLQDYGHPMATIEIAKANAMGRDSFSPRRVPLLKKRRIIEMGKRVCVNDNGRIRQMLAIGLPEWKDKLPEVAVAAE
jgi:hypothetical protein